MNHKWTSHFVFSLLPSFIVLCLLSSLAIPLFKLFVYVLSIFDKTQMAAFFTSGKFLARV